MTLNSWHNMVNEALPKMSYPPASTQLQIAEMYHSALYKLWFPFTFIFEIIIIFIVIIITPIIRFKLMGRPKVRQSQRSSNARKLEKRFRFGKNHFDLVKHPENVYTVHLCLDSNNIFVYCTGYLSMPLDTWTHFVNAIIPKVMLPRYDFVTIFRSSGLFLVTWATFSAHVTRVDPKCLYNQRKHGNSISFHFQF